MATYSLTMSLDQTALNTLTNAGENILISKTTTGASATTVVWLSIPGSDSITVTWEEDYYFYESTTTLNSGAKIQAANITSQPILTGQYYIFAANSSITQTGAAGPTTSFNIMNSYTPINNNLVFGLSQSANISTVSKVTAPLCANVIPYNQTGNFTPLETVNIWTGATFNNGSVIAAIGGSALTVVLTTAVPSASIKYNDSTNAFIMT